jgi:DDE superfamily endonuclease
MRRDDLSGGDFERCEQGRGAVPLVVVAPTGQGAAVRQLQIALRPLRGERWLKKHSNVHFHFTPTRSSWLNQIEIWFLILQGQSLNGASFTDIEQLQEHIDAFIAAYNETAEPFAWTKKKVYQRRFKNRRITQL